MKKFLGVVAVVLLLQVGTGPDLRAMDFENMTNRELFELRGAIQNAPEEDRQVYQEEWERRLAEMADEEKKEFAEADETDNTGDGRLSDPIVPARGYEKQVDQGEGRIIFGGFPDPGK